MGITFTLVVQAVHFFIAYGIIRWLILGPLFRIICERNKRVDDLVQSIDQAKGRQAEQEREVSAIWQSCRQQFGAVRPLLEAAPERIEKAVLVPEPVPLDQQTEDEIAKEVVGRLKERMLV